jgi:ribosomal protein S18 acetylase RimI-like enzyme
VAAREFGGLAELRLRVDTLERVPKISAALFFERSVVARQSGVASQSLSFKGVDLVEPDSRGLDMLEGRDDLVVLWDIRVSPNARRLGVGSALFRSLEAWARARSCRELQVETQNTNGAACRFYEHQGCRLKRVDRHAYSSLPGEVQLIWSKVVGA